MTRTQAMMDHFQRAWDQLEAGRLVSEEIVDGHTMSVVKVADTFFLGIEKRGRHSTQREIDRQSAEQVILAMMSLRVAQEEKMTKQPANSKGERQ